MSQGIPPPAPSPRPDVEPPQPGEANTGFYPATRDFVREVNKSGVWKVAAGVGSFALLCFVTGITVSKALAQDAKDAGIEAASSVQKQANETDQRLDRFSSDFTEHVQTESAARVRMELKLNALLDRLDVKDPAPTPKDGGR